MKTIESKTWLRITFFCCCFICDLTGLAEPTNRFQVSDMYRIESLAAGTFSPDGQSFIFERTRPFSLNHDPASTENPYHRTDFWLVGEGDAKPHLISAGERKSVASLSTSFWSPDGQRLAFFSTRGGKEPHLWLWERAPNEFHKAAKYPVNYRCNVKWIDATHVLCVFACDSEVGWVNTIGDQIKRTTAGWSNIWAGQVATVSAIESGATNLTRTGEYSANELAMIDVTTGKETVLDRGVGLDTEISPNGERAVVFQDGLRSINTAVRKLGYFSRETSVDLIDLKSGLLPTANLSSVVVSLGKGFLARPSVAWSPDSKQIALVGTDTSKDENPARLLIYDLATDHLAKSLSEGIEVATNKMIYWLTDEKLVVCAKTLDSGNTNLEAQSRTDWWAISSGTKPRNLTAEFKKPPVELLQEPGKNSFICQVDDALWRIFDNGDRAQNLSASLTKPVKGMIFPDDNKLKNVLVLKLGEGKTNDLVWLDLHTGAAQPITLPSAEATLADYSASSGTMIFGKNDRTGCRLWRTTIKDSAQTPELLVETSTFLADIATGELRTVNYTSMDGQPLVGWILLPAGYEAGKKYPMVTWVYHGQVFTADANPGDTEVSINSCFALNLHLLASHGYAVLFPSMPLKSYGAIEDPLLELTKGVTPAVAKAIDLGIADPSRIGVMGQSYGGFSTYGLITQTRLFKAAVSLAGPCDWVSYYGTFEPQVRYLPDPNLVFTFPHFLMETGQGRMGNPPWKDLGRYIRNSPITYVDRVETPLLIVQGDLDYVMIQQGEEFFQSLYRQGKMAEFARYWGEGHVFESPANIEDMWNRIFRWFDTYLKADAKVSTGKGNDAGKPAADK